MGTRVDPALFLDRQIIGQALIITVLAIISEVLGAGMGGTGMGLRSAAMIGIGTVSRGEVGLIVASLGLSRGIIGAEFLAMVVVMSIATTLIVPLALSWLSQPRVRRPAPVRGERMGTSGRLPGM
jgi:Kef-type K+ transport system membrane component KefB